MRVYVAAPYHRAHEVRAVHERLVAHGITPTSTWAMNANGPEQHVTDELMCAAAESNDIDLESSDAVLVMSYRDEGGEMYAEARLALLLGMPLIWVGRRILSSYRFGVVMADDLDEAIWLIAYVAKQTVEIGDDN